MPRAALPPRMARMPDTPGSASPRDEDRRQFERIPARIDVRFTHPSDAAKALRAYSLNFSVGGLCVRTQKTYAIGDQLRLEMKISGHEFRLAGIVAWARSGAIGVRFHEVTDEDRERLTQLVTQFRT